LRLPYELNPSSEEFYCCSKVRHTLLFRSEDFEARDLGAVSWHKSRALYRISTIQAGDLSVVNKRLIGFNKIHSFA
jgi:hypothetical protein